MRAFLQIFAAVLALTLMAAGAARADGHATEKAGMVLVKSPFGSAETLKRVDAAIAKRGFKVFTTIDHAAAAKEVGLEMPDAVVVIFGNPKGGTGIMLKQPTVAIDLPLKLLVIANDAGEVQIGYNAPAHMASLFERHGLPTNMGWYEKLLGGIVGDAVK